MNIDDGFEVYPNLVKLDTNNYPNIEEFFKKNDLGTFTGMVSQSGFCSYPIYLLNKKKFDEIAETI